MYSGDWAADPAKQAREMAEHIKRTKQSNVQKRVRDLAINEELAEYLVELEQSLVELQQRIRVLEEKNR